MLLNTNQADAPLVTGIAPTLPLTSFCPLPSHLARENNEIACASHHFLQTAETINMAREMAMAEAADDAASAKEEKAKKEAAHASVPAPHCPRDTTTVQAGLAPGHTSSAKASLTSPLRFAVKFATRSSQS